MHIRKTLGNSDLMSVPLPDRYVAEVRLGRHEDVEEWLATDTVLDRPVMVRVLSPEVPPKRAREFLDEIRAISSVNHPHLAEVYEAGTSDATTWMVAEWVGGVTLADRAQAESPITPEEFLPNAAGLAAGLSMLHQAGLIHGAITDRAVLFSAAHPAKLTAYARTHHGSSQKQDVIDLANVLKSALTGGGTGAGPSELSDLIDPSVDQALDLAASGQLSAAELAAHLRGAPSVPQPELVAAAGWRWLIPAAVLIIAATLIAAFSDLAGDGSDVEPFALEGTVTTTTVPITTTTTTVAPPPEPVEILVLDILDPSGDGERDADLPLLADGDITTGWRTERYFSPIQLLKPGVGVSLVLDRSPQQIEIDGSAETRYEVRWASTFPDNLDDWETITAGRFTESTEVLDLPDRTGGFWLIWLTELAHQGVTDDDPPRDFYFSYLYEVRFSP